MFGLVLYRVLSELYFLSKLQSLYLRGATLLPLYEAHHG